MKVRPATQDDIPELMAIARLYVQESKWGYTFHSGRSLDMLEGSISDPYSALVVGEIDGAIGGAYLASIGYEWTVEPICYLTKFYVGPWARGTPLARLLVKNLCAWSDSAGALDLFATASARIGADQQFINLLKKHGFADAGTVMVRRNEFNFQRQEERPATAASKTQGG